MKHRTFWIAAILVLTVGIMGCSKKADPNQPIDKIQEEAQTMSVKDLEANAQAYADQLRKKKAEISKIKEKMRKMPIDKIFENKFLTNKIAKIGQQAETLFERYGIYVRALQERGADISKVRLS